LPCCFFLAPPASHYMQWLTVGKSKWNNSLPSPSAKDTNAFQRGDSVEYHSQSQGLWISAKVLTVNADGTYTLDVKPNVIP